MKQAPPFSRNVPTADKALRFATGYIGRAAGRRERSRRITADLWGSRRLEIGTRGAAGQKGGGCGVDARGNAHGLGSGLWSVIGVVHSFSKSGYTSSRS